MLISVCRPVSDKADCMIERFTVTGVESGDDSADGAPPDGAGGLHLFDSVCDAHKVTAQISRFVETNPQGEPYPEKSRIWG